MNSNKAVLEYELEKEHKSVDLLHLITPELSLVKHDRRSNPRPAVTPVKAFTHHTCIHPFTTEVSAEKKNTTMKRTIECSYHPFQQNIRYHNTLKVSCGFYLFLHLMQQQQKQQQQNNKKIKENIDVLMDFSRKSDSAEERSKKGGKEEQRKKEEEKTAEKPQFYVL
ncbi:hypothetical protein CEXT_579771 [Caerostris extrusa]|uniref:Uncharacterized protein n=1 Tax=Caerostris extrusa TaxID=172846 RepID=A0AAV4YCV5_CAEEX|nr:hypothetical protein CEXT_579771 [Caerostris extrusa]